MARKRIPLFPLEIVLFPGMSLPLHIFEPRYKVMIRRCIKDETEFGVILGREKGVAAVGCTAEIVEVIKEYPDGQMEIMTKGRTVFRISELFDSEPYYEAEVDYLPEETSPTGPQPNPELLELYERCHKLFYGQPADPSEREDAVSLAYHIAADLPLEPDRKQSILEIRDETERRSRLIQQLKELLPQLEQRFRMREKARGNGHARA